MKQACSFCACFFLGCISLLGQTSILDDEANIRYYVGNYYGNWMERKVDGRHTLITDTSAYDPYCNDDIKIIPGTKRKVLRLGNHQVGAQADRITYTFTVTQDKSLFVYQYAIVVQDPNHVPSHQPKFEITITDTTGNLIDEECGYYKVVAGPDAEERGFKKGTRKTQYKDWVSEAINLRPFIGQRITIQFTVFDCEETGHFGYAYLDAYYGALEVKTKYCKGDETATLIAPEGFASYEWLPSGYTGRRLKINAEQLQDTFACTLTSVTGCQITLPAVVEMEKLEIVAKAYAKPVSCFGKDDGRLAVRVSGGYKPYRFLWNDGNLDQDRASVKAGTYRVQITDAVGCVDSAKVNVKDSSPMETPYEKLKNDIACNGAESGSAFIKMKDTSRFQLVWSHGYKGFSPKELEPGTYTFEISGKKGCSVDSIIINEPASPLHLQGQILTSFNGYQISCFGKKRRRNYVVRKWRNA